MEEIRETAGYEETIEYLAGMKRVADLSGRGSERLRGAIETAAFVFEASKEDIERDIASALMLDGL